MTAPFIPETAPFSEDQRAWLNGFLAGMYSSDSHAGGAPAVAATPVTILFGSQTGTSETLSKKAAKQLKAANCAPTILDMGDCSVDDLKDVQNLLIITSTYGEGEPPDNAQSLHTALMADSAPSLEGVQYSVLGLGDSSYADFCQCSKEFDARLEALGAKRCADMVECDGDADEPFAQWIAAVTPVLGEAGAAPVDAGDDEEGSDEPEFTKKNPFAATLLKTENLNKEGSSKQTHHIEISLEGSGIDYEVGDALGVWPENNAHLVDEIIAAAGFEPDELTPLPHDPDAQLFEALRFHYDVSVLTEPFLIACARLTKHPELKEIVADEAKRKAYIAGRGLVDPIVDFEVKFPTTEYLVAPLKQLSPRLYSISSSPKAHPGEVHLTVGKVTYDTHGRKRQGVCSTYLSDHQLDRPVKVYMHSNKAFRLSENDDAPAIMIGPGTGIAPFRAFLEEREARGAKGKNWLLFGDQHQATDFLYEDQITDWMKSGLLTRFDTAFSRDQAEKIYVQNRIVEHAEEFYAWLEEGGAIYICGDASRMAKDVDAAIHKAVEVAGGKSEDEAKAYVEALKKAKRYLRDVY
ncbi:MULTISPECIES: sulfite reductase flavoprotein subunit alpha [unclassified Lentimonas]|uniref:diflavin oxidoreductase n=1 Tax=unclassified Lentimonas TaxID=2630993 RepID=UPI001320984C|nr:MULTISPECIES: flavodoxin domain-containing protein [unclassified Lentimonas]CAA6678022.1 Sulfite reductase [NADPH] flavoprotein alpha-component (EC [Lentimonas sp. CC4]CAA6686996.1 Sulfite reductase [NADPH] flavoprotein alpha-component (EC [Lentimonas sp. CC6]CAA7075839.1 Sulfite reductase [NADPH] flavoprotein alpha-component (EC [Lentimonas sp. CC4]CAA7172035.1 Sulfite reductase [NADPH] flavoprotein alpha-component (EC [Lentimonas sp. CC21]CAA7182902.1 Sulfite reductase [NADPH] flavoprotei